MITTLRSMHDHDEIAPCTTPHAPDLTLPDYRDSLPVEWMESL
jgi:hypothetical protein